MKIELMKQARMGVEGKGILRSLQNDTLPLIDLLIRESLQNSLDATQEGVEATYVDVGICDFEVEMLAEQLEGLTETLKSRYSGQLQKAIYVSDKNTTGLIGDVRKKEGNIYNLIYTIQKNQEQEGAGGSWGLGKTSYFRIGNGIVLYYSRVKLSGGSYEERLAGSLIEDSTQPNKLLDNDRGIAWWGKRDSDDTDKYDHTYPLTDAREIHVILDIFDIKPYIEDETGTTIIIPFVDEKRVLPKYEDELRELKWWETSLEAAIKIAIQKWYSPRIWNLKYDGAYLRPSINGKDLTPDQFEPFFRQIHELYVCGLEKKGRSNINVDVIELKRSGISSDKGVAGWVSYGLYSKEDLQMTAPNNEPHPLEYFGYDNLEEMGKTNSKIVVYTRKPGMIIEYDINGEWSKTVTPSEEEFLLSFFIPNSKGLLYPKVRERGILTLEDYLRKTEKSDHAEWEDVTLNNINVTIVTRIRRNVSKAMQERYSEDDEKAPQSRASVLGKRIGDKLLPKHGVGGKSPVQPATLDGGGGTGRPRRKRNISLEVLNVDINEVNELVVNVLLNIKEDFVANVSIDLMAGTKGYNEQQWKKDMGVEAKYPFLIKKLVVERMDGKSIGISSEYLKDDKVAITFIPIENNSCFKVENKSVTDKLEVKLKLLIEANDPLIQPSIVVSEVKRNG